MKKPMIDTMTRPKFDGLFTPKHGVNPILNLVHGVFSESGIDPIIWECTDPGTSEIAAEFRACGYQVVSTDITTGFNFLRDTPTFPFDVIVTNPPYSRKEEFLKRCYEIGKPFALLMPLTALEGIARGKLYRQHGISVIVLDRRLDFTGAGSCWFNTSWFYHGFTADKNRLYFWET